MRKYIPLILLIAGVCLIVGGFLYDAVFAGIPYQDPTPELRAKYAFHAGIASWAMDLGFCAIAASVLAFFADVLMGKKKAGSAARSNALTEPAISHAISRAPISPNVR